MKLELHAHTSETSRCGKVPAADMVALYAKAGYGAIVFTDHIWDNCLDMLLGESGRPLEERAERYLLGYRAAKHAGKALGINVLLGAEARAGWLTPNDYLIYGLDESDIPWLIETLDARTTPLEFTHAARSRGFITAQAHPFRNHMSPGIPAELDAIEAYNGNPRHNSHNARAKALATREGKLMISGSDAHQPEDVARGGFITPNVIRDNTDLLRFLRESTLNVETVYDTIAIETVP